ncbi:MAG: ABC transporter ATP-binding protein [Nocardioidaceae bacterium]
MSVHGIDNQEDQPLVQLDAVGCTYGAGERAVVAVHDATARVLAGEHLAVIGPSGSGKSTLLHLMAGLLPPTSGEVTWPGLGGSPAGRPGLVGTVFQGPSLLPPLDVLENVALPLLLAGGDQQAANTDAERALAALGLTSLEHALPEELSGGQAQRVAVARVLATRPRLICADEPTGQLDRHNADHVVDVLLAAASELGAAIVVATHDPHISRRLEHSWQVDDGRVRTGALA